MIFPCPSLSWPGPHPITVETQFAPAMPLMPRSPDSCVPPELPGVGKSSPVMDHVSWRTVKLPVGGSFFRRKWVKTFFFEFSWFGGGKPVGSTLLLDSIWLGNGHPWLYTNRNVYKCGKRIKKHQGMNPPP